MKLRLRLRLTTTDRDRPFDTGVFEADSRSLVSAAEPKGKIDSSGPAGDVQSHLASLPAAWVRDFLRSV